jgi:hypothetical protein
VIAEFVAKGAVKAEHKTLVFQADFNLEASE